MGLIQRLKIKIGLDKSNEDEEWPSIVFLLRKPHLPSPEEALKLAREAWGAAGPVDLVGTVPPHSYVFRANPIHFAMHFAPVRYEVEGLPLLPVQQQSRDEHNAWLSVDLPGKCADELRTQGRLAGAYRALMYFADKYWSTNVLALYFPAEVTVLPNFGNLIASISESRRTGINLDFLKEPKKS